MPKIKGMKGKKGKKAKGSKKSSMPSVKKELGDFALALRHAGAGLGGLAGMRKAGYAGGAMASKIFGMGDYSVKHNSIMKNSNDVPSFANGGRWVDIAHKEYLCDVISPAASPGWGIVSTFNLNPGLSTSFPWLSTVAANYEEFEFLGLVFCFESTSAAWSGSSQALGSVQIATQYDANDPNFASQVEMLQYEFSTSSSVATTCYHPVECNPKDNPRNNLYVRANANVTSIQLYDLGKTTIALQGISAANVNVGKLWVTYRVRLGKPKMLAGQIGYQVGYARYTLSNSLTNTTYFTGATKVTDGIGVTFTPNAIVFPPTMQTGTYLIRVIIYGASVALTTATPVYTNCRASAAVSVNDNPTGFTSQEWIQNYNVTITAQNATFALGTASLPTGIFAANLLITQIPLDT